MAGHIAQTETGHTERSSRRKRIFELSAVGGAIAAGLLIWQQFGRSEAPVYAFAQVERGDIVKTISATGKLQAVVTVQVGSQVSGRIAEIHADFNSRVKNGAIIAKLDPSLMAAQLNQAQGNLANAEAKLQTAMSAVTNAEANVAAAEANREKTLAAQQDAERAYTPINEIMSTGAVSTREVQLAEATLAQANAQCQQASAQVDQAKAQLLSARSQVNEAKAQVQQMKASVELASANLDYCVIRAPIDGVVIARNVDVGQTVAASLQAPTLFLIANDLTQMQVLADIDEADVGQLGQDSKISFTVDAFPGDVFHGTVSQIRLNPQTVQNVTTYTAVIDVRNPELKLRPGMTANVEATVAESGDVLTVPNAALRFRADGAADRKGAAPGNARPGSGRRSVTLWKRGTEGTLRPVPVSLGITDGVRTAVLSGDVKAGDQVATGQNAGKSQAAPAARNPLMPFGGGRGGKR